MVTLGAICVLAALALTVGTWVAYVWGLAKNQENLLRFARYGVVATFAAVTAASLVLMALLVAHDISVKYVAEHTSRDLELGYTMSAFWAGQEGSLLLWEWLLAGFTVIVAFRKADNPRLADLSAAVLSILSTFFLVLLTFVTMPFTLTPVALEDGLGLNPQLQNIGMVFHPPSLYVGYVGFAVPFAYALAALILNQADAAWFRRMRRWMLVSWVFLGIGIVLGAQWAYVELGWGGYWAWDPVENASLVPWLTATAYLHAGVVADRRGGLRRWGLILLFATFILTLVGTFLTRSGVIQSVHAYTEGGLLGPLFASFIGLTTIVSMALLVWRWRHLDAPPQEKFSIVSREPGFLAVTALFAALVVAVLVGTLYPIFSQLGGGQQQALTVSYYEMVSAPLSMLIVVLLGVCPALRWRGQPWRDLLLYLAVPLAAGLVVAVLAVLVGSREPFVVLSFGACAFAIVSAVEATILDWRRRNQAAESKGAGANLWGLLTSNRRRYGGYLIHIGVTLLVAGVVGSTVYTQAQTVTLLKGESATFGNYSISFMTLSVETLDNGQAIVRAPLAVTRGSASSVLMPHLVYYPTSDQPASEPAIWGGLGQFFMEDFYVLMAELDPHAGQATFQMHINPLMDWIWAGGFVMLLGSLWALWPGRRAGKRGEQTQEGKVAEQERVKKTPLSKQR
jgi:cytochrome c-type biogenesis protein CcmF